MSMVGKEYLKSKAGKRYQKVKDTQTDKHINTMTRSGLEAGPSGEANSLISTKKGPKKART